MKENSMMVEGSKWERKRWILICFGIQDGRGHVRGKEHPEEQASVGNRERTPTKLTQEQRSLSRMLAGN